MIPTFEEYITTYDILEIEKNEKKYLKFNTEFENLTILFKPIKLFHSKAPVIRFINTEYYEFYGSNELQGAYFLPSHIEEKLNNCFADETMDSDCNLYLPSDMQIDSLSVSHTSIKNSVSNSSKGECGTSLFAYYNTDEQGVFTLITELKENISALRDFDVAVGNVPINYGIVEQSDFVKTKDPESRHCSFWKFENVKNFNELAKNFKQLDWKVKTC